jgi:hypothetical protein
MKTNESTESKLETNISSTVVTNYGAYVSLYYLCRALDVSGTGKATFDLSFAAGALNRSDRTIERYISKGIARGLFTQVLRDSDLVTIYYQSLFKVAAARGLESLGTTYTSEVSDYKQMYQVAVLAVAVHKQKASKHKSKANLPKPQRSYHKTVSTEKIHTQVRATLGKPVSPSNLCKGVSETGFAVSGRYVLVNTDLPGVTQSGVSHKGIAEGVSRHPSSVGRNLRKYSKGQYVRTAHTSRQIQLEYQEAVEGYGDYNVSRFLLVNGTPFLKYTNHYLCDDDFMFTFTKCKQLKANYRKFFSTLAASSLRCLQTDSLS